MKAGDEMDFWEYLANGRGRKREQTNRRRRFTWLEWYEEIGATKQMQEMQNQANIIWWGKTRKDTFLGKNRLFIPVWVFF